MKRVFKFLYNCGWNIFPLEQTGHRKACTNFGHEFHIPKQRKDTHINMCPEHIQFVSYSWKNTIVTSTTVVISFDVGDCLVGLHVLPHQLTGNHYQDVLFHDLLKLLEDVPLAVRARVCYMHDGAPAHFSWPMRVVLNNTQHDWR
jgi:hypothetical protein